MLPILPKLNRRLLASLATMFVVTLSAAGQKTNQYDPGTPPQHAAGVSQMGSYTSADLGTVNLSNGALNFRLPLGTVGGRGFSIPITLNYTSKPWSASIDTDQDLSGTTYKVAFADFDMADTTTPYGHRVGVGWTISGTPWLTATIVNIDKFTSGPWIGCPKYKLAKLTLHLPDKGEIEFRDDNTDGAPLVTDCATNTTVSRGTRWHATDGSGMIFINDVGGGVQSWPIPNLSGQVITADGTRYQFSAGGLAQTITDRHGNRITIQSTSFTDQLGRVTTIQLNVNDPETGQPLAALVTLPGYNGQPRYYKIKSGILNQHYRSDLSVALPVVTGDYDPRSLYSNWPVPGTVLFDLSYKLYQQRIDDRDVLTELSLPNGTSLRFKYNQFGEVAEVQMPAGGKVQYDYGAAFSLASGNSPVWEATGDLHTNVNSVDRAVKERRIYPDGITTSPPAATWTYSYGQAPTEVIARAGSLAGPIVARQRHYFLEPLRYTHGTFGTPEGTHYSRWTTGVEWRTESLDANGTILAANEQDFTQRTPVVWTSGYTQEQPANDNRVNEERKFLETGASAKVQVLYDQYNNPTEVKEYDFDQSLKRRQVTTYVNSSTPINGLDYTSDPIRLLRLPREQFIYDGTGNLAAKGETRYDETSYPLLTYSSVTGWVSPGTNARGNPTTTRQWLNTASIWLEAHIQYDQCGSMRKTWDANGKLSQIEYSATYHHAYPTLTKSPIPDPTGQFGSSTELTSSTTYDFHTGLVVSAIDQNGNRL